MKILLFDIILIINGVSAAGIFGCFYCNNKKLIGEKDTYIIQDFVAEGSFGKIFKASQLSTEKTVIIKKQKNITNKSDFLDEIKINRMIKNWDIEMDSPLVLSIDDNYWISSSGDSDKQLFWMAFHYYPLGSLNYDKVSRMGFPYLKYIGYDILLGLEVLHSNGYVYNDLKVDNIIISDQTSSSVHVKLIDFGLVTPVESTRFCGSMRSISPEVMLSLLANPIQYPFKRHLNSDMWSFGVVMHLINTGRNLFHKEFISIRNIIRILRRASYHELYQTYPEFYKGIKDEEKHLYRIAKTVQCDEKSEFQYEESCYSYGIGPDCYCDLILKCLRFNPEKRISSSEALNHPFFV